MTNAKSILAARTLGDLMARLGWTRYGVHCMPTDSPSTVAIQYRSDYHGDTRVVTADPLRLTQWLKGRKPSPRWGEVAAILDRKAPMPAAPRQAELDLAGAPEIVKRSLKP